MFNFGAMNERLKLSELNGLVKKAISSNFAAPIWVIAEISELKSNRSGHCYLALIEKDENGDTVLAQARATIWSYTYRMLKPYFETTTGQQLVEGLKVLVSVSVEFHELYGYSLNIRDIDPTYTLGDMARRRLEIIARLKSDGVAEMNKELELPQVLQKIAVISSQTAAGYQDFVDQLVNNQQGYKFHVKLFPAIMQGNQAESSIIGALEQIYLYEGFFDAVVIIRGGGSQADLSCFDNYNLAYFITQFPLPVITGIGHEKDDSIVDLVAHTRLKTPTAVADFLIGSLFRFEQDLDGMSNSFKAGAYGMLLAAKNTIDQFTRVLAPLTRERISKKQVQLSQTVWKIDNSVKKYIKFNNTQLERKEEFIRHEFLNFIQKRSRVLEKISRQLTGSVLRLTTGKTQQLGQEWQRCERLIGEIFTQKKHHLELSLQKAKLTDPHIILARGYSITVYNGHALKSTTELVNGTIIETRLYDGSILSDIINVKKENQYDYEQKKLIL
jgi:exodeoxyribonuclease VII large subunit